MATLIKRLGAHWRDVLAVLTVLLIISSLYLIGYGIGRSNQLAKETQESIECIARFYGKTNRANATITNISQCRITR